MDVNYERGKRDGLAGLSPSSTPKEYMDGYKEGRRIKAEEDVKRGPWTFNYYPWLPSLFKRRF